jgi:hypothetical protein
MHGAKRYRYLCSSEGCTNQVQRRGVAKGMGQVAIHDESTAFTNVHGSAYDETIGTLPNHPNAAASANQKRSRNPPKVILCQEVTDHVEV